MQYFSTDIPQTASELFDGELVIAHYGSGLYYSISPAGALVWQGLKQGLAVELVISWLTEAFPARAETIPAEVSAFVARMCEEGLLLPTPAANAGSPPELALAELGPMELERFEDLQELLLLDPVHDVAEAGWPHRADEN